MPSPHELRQQRPTLLVCAERMSSGHAMHRSYAASLRQLRSKFTHHLHGHARATSQADTHELFDEVEWELETGVSI